MQQGTWLTPPTLQAAQPDADATSTTGGPQCRGTRAPKSDVHRTSTYLLAPEACAEVCVAVQALVQPVIWWGLGRALALCRGPLRCLCSCCLAHSLLPERPTVKKKAKGELAGHLAGWQGLQEACEDILPWHSITGTHENEAENQVQGILSHLASLSCCVSVSSTAVAPMSLCCCSALLLSKLKVRSLESSSSRRVAKVEPPLAALLRLAAAAVAAAMAAAGSCSPSSSCSAALLRILRFLGFPSMVGKASGVLQGPDVMNTSRGGHFCTI